MHKTFYASGFLFHLPSQQILLQQKQSTSPVVSPWIFFGNKHAINKKPEKIFEETLSKLLKININKLNKIYSYTKDYFQIHTLFYATLDELEEFAPVNGYVFRWFSFKDVLKIKISEQTKHDIVIGQRVIDALERDNDANLQKLIEDASNE